MTRVGSVISPLVRQSVHIDTELKYDPREEEKESKIIEETKSDFSEEADPSMDSTTVMPEF